MPKAFNFNGILAAIRKVWELWLGSHKLHIWRD